MNLDKKLYTLKYSPDTESHLKPDFEQCKLCITKCCVNICPAQVYEWNEETQELIVNFENCLGLPASANVSTGNTRKAQKASPSNKARSSPDGVFCHQLFKHDTNHSAPQW